MLTSCNWPPATDSNWRPWMETSARNRGRLALPRTRCDLPPVPDDFQYDVFLSHNQADKPRVWRLAERLRAAGRRVWFDE